MNGRRWCCLLTGALCLIWVAWSSNLADDPVEITVAEEATSRPSVQNSLQLEFVIDAGEPITLEVTCASGPFEVVVDQSNDDGQRTIEIQGDLTVDRSGAFLLSFEAALQTNDARNGSESVFQAVGSVIILESQTKQLASFPGPLLSVTAKPDP